MQKTEAFRQATVSEYITWLRGYIATGGKITHAYGYPFSRWEFLVALRDFTTDGEGGAKAVNIIVPKGCHKRAGAMGHTQLYLMDRYQQRGGLVPVFDDLEFDTVPGVFEAREVDAEEDRKFREALHGDGHDSDVSNRARRGR